jgi:hypothetical protein
VYTCSDRTEGDMCKSVYFLNSHNGRVGGQTRLKEPSGCTDLFYPSLQ